MTSCTETRNNLATLEDLFGMAMATYKPYIILLVYIDIINLSVRLQEHTGLYFTMW